MSPFRFAVSEASHLFHSGLLRAFFPVQFITLKLEPPTGSVLHANNGNTVTQTVALTNSMHGQVQLALDVPIASARFARH